MACALSCIPETQPEQEEAPPQGLAVTCLSAPVYHRASWGDMPQPSEGEHRGTRDEGKQDVASAAHPSSRTGS